MFALTLAVCRASLATPPPRPAVISVDTTKRLPLPSRRNFSGANLQIAYTGTSYLDPKMQALAATMNLGWTRFPAGTVDDVYDWRTGDLREDWIAQFKGSKGVAYGNFIEDIEINRGKGLNKLEDYAAFLRTQHTGSGPAAAPTHTIGVINTFTDTPESAAALVKAAAEKNLRVDVWELGNEPFFFEKFYPSATAYLDAVAPFAQAIRKADPRANLAVYLQRNDKWIADLAAYKNRYWNQLYWHAYPTPPKAEKTSPEETLAFYNGFLANTTSRFVDETLVPLFGPSMQLEASEFNIGAMRGGIYGALFVAEYTLRMAANPHVTQVGMHTLVGREGERDGAILPSKDHRDDVLAAFHASKAIDTSHADFGYFVSPYGLALQVINGVINTSEALWPTSVSGGAMVSTPPAGAAPIPGQVPALYAQAFSTPGKTKHLLVTNKAASPQDFSVLVNGKPLQTNFTTVSMGSADPMAKNTPSAPNAVHLDRATAKTTVTVPAYGVMDVSWTE